MTDEEKLEQLRKDIQEGIKSLEEHGGIPAEEVKARILERRKLRKSQKNPMVKKNANQQNNS